MIITSTVLMPADLNDRNPSVRVGGVVILTATGPLSTMPLTILVSCPTLGSLATCHIRLAQLLCLPVATPSTGLGIPGRPISASVRSAGDTSGHSVSGMTSQPPGFTTCKPSADHYGRVNRLCWMSDFLALKIALSRRLCLQSTRPARASPADA